MLVREAYLLAGPTASGKSAIAAELAREMGEWILRASLHSACYLCPLSGGPSACGTAHVFAILLGKRMASFEMGLEIRRFDFCNSSVEKEFSLFYN